MLYTIAVVLVVLWLLGLIGNLVLTPLVLFGSFVSSSRRPRSCAGGLEWSFRGHLI